MKRVRCLFLHEEMTKKSDERRRCDVPVTGTSELDDLRDNVRELNAIQFMEDVAPDAR